MRCENCEREIDNAQLWHLGADPKAPFAWSMRVLCWDCRAHPGGSGARPSEPSRRLVLVPDDTPPDTNNGHPDTKAS